MAAVQVRVSLTSEMDIQKLEAKWAELESHANQHIFLSWTWLEAWLLTLVDTYYVVEAVIDDRVVGLGVLVGKTRSCLSLFSVQQFWLHRTGDEKRDKVWIEYNDFLLHKDHEPVVREAMVSEILRHCDELVIGVSESEVFDQLSVNKRIFSKTWSQPTYKIDFAKVEDNFLNCLSKNTRNQIKRAKKAYDEQGLSLTRASSLEEALCFFKECGDLHRVKWANSGYLDQEFTGFHQALIKSGFDRGRVEFFKVMTTDKVIGYLYYLVFNKQVYFYLSGIAEEKDNKLKPGLVSHQVAIEHFLERENRTYDFMAGEARYKKSMSNCASVMSMVTVANSSWLGKVELALKNVKQRITTRL